MESGINVRFPTFPRYYHPSLRFSTFKEGGILKHVSTSILEGSGGTEIGVHPADRRSYYEMDWCNRLSRKWQV
ncbi:hypothetical protein ABID47_001082 [Paenibacillus favisporus]|uniref:Uncharacterized protein n=1 Tax=Paenibacillus favisporus TaxID=221028 RepID=A0ABV2EXZ2_9BACL